MIDRLFDSGGLRHVDPASPLDMSKPLNSGLVGHWVPLPTNWGGKRFFDLGGKWAGTMTGSFGWPTWRGATRPGSYAMLDHNGLGAQRAQFTGLDAAFPNSEGTLAVWVRKRLETPANLATSGFCSVGATGSGLSTQYPDQSGNLQLSVFDTGFAISGVAAPTGKTAWHHVAIVSKAGTNGYRFYFNGRLFASATRNGWQVGTTTSFGGWNFTGTQLGLDGWSDDWRLYNRGLNDAEILALYQESKAGYPTLLRRSKLYVGMQSAVVGVGSLNLADAATSGAAGVAVPTSGSLTLDDAALSGSATTSVVASGSMVLDPTVFSGAAGVAVAAVGSLAVDPCTFQGSATLVVDAIGSLVGDDALFSGSTEPAVVYAAGSLALADVVFEGFSGLPAIEAVGSLLLADVTFSGAGPPEGPATLREAVYAKLGAVEAIQADVGDRIYFYALPQSLRRPVQPAVTYYLTSRDYGRHFAGSNAIATTRVRVSCWSMSELTSLSIANAIRSAFFGYRGKVGQVTILGCFLEDETDLPEPAGGGTSDYIYQVVLTFSVVHRITPPDPG
jgi:hypothetical protein